MANLTPSDCARLGALHREALPDSTVSELGQGYAESFYRYLSTSPHERVFVRRDGSGEVVSACVLSLHPSSLRRRLFWHTPLLFYAVPWFLSRQRGAKKPSRIETFAAANRVAEELPELILIFTAPGSRSRGLGASLLGKCEKLLAEERRPEYIVRTVDEPDNRALQFYANNGFVACGQSAEHGRAFRVFRKAVF